jgi:hypothetical protein
VLPLERALATLEDEAVAPDMRRLKRAAPEIKVKVEDSLLTKAATSELDFSK